MMHHKFLKCVRSGEREGIWMHVDAAYAGSAMVCPEFRYLLDGVQYAETIGISPNKWLNVNLDCATMWVRNSNLLSEAYSVDPLYTKYQNQRTMPEYRNWGISMGRRFRSLKLWFVLRMYGLKGLQDCIRKDVRLAHEFEELVKTDDRFEIFGKVIMGLVCFRLKESNKINERLLKEINREGRLYMVPASVKGFYSIRFAICSHNTTSSDITFAWKAIQENWGISMGRRFRSLKLWFVLRMYGLKGLQDCIRKDARLAHGFEELVKTDDRFEIFGKVIMGLVCFRLKESNKINERLLKEINREGRLYMVPASVKGFYSIRFAICSHNTTPSDITFAWKAIQEVTEKILVCEHNSEI